MHDIFKGLHTLIIIGAISFWIALGFIGYHTYQFVTHYDVNISVQEVE